MLCCVRVDQLTFYLIIKMNQSSKKLRLKIYLTICIYQKMLNSKQLYLRFDVMLVINVLTPKQINISMINPFAEVYALTLRLSLPIFHYIMNRLRYLALSSFEQATPNLKILVDLFSS